MSLVNLLFHPHLGEVSQKGRAPPGQLVRAGKSSGIASFLQEELSLGAIVVLSFHWGVPTFSSCLFVFKSQRIPDWFGVGRP